MEERRKVVSLVRVSTAKQLRDKELDYQRSQIRFAASIHNLNVVEEYPLEDISGLVVHETAQFEAIKRHIAIADIHGLVIPDISRLARTTDFETLGDLMRPFSAIMGGNKKLLWMRREELDITRSSDRDKIWQALRYAEDEREMLKMRTAPQKEILRTDPHTKIDKLPKGIIPVPIVGQKKRYNFAYEPETKRKIAEACNRLLAGESLSDIALDLGYRSGNGMKETLRSEWWIGYKTRLKTTHSRQWIKEKQKYFVGGRFDHENPIRVRTNLADDPAVTKEVWDAVQVKLDTNRDRWTQRRSHSKQFLATGLVCCGVCSEKLYHKKQTGRNHPGYYWCRSHAVSYRNDRRKNPIEDCGFGFVRADALDAEINLQVTLYLTDQKFIEHQLVESTNAEATEEKKRVVVRLENELDELEAERKRMLSAIRKGIATEDDYAADFKEVKLRSESLRGRMTLLNTEISTSLSARTRKQMALRIAADFANFPYGEFEERKALVSKYLRRIVVKKNEVTGDLTLHFDVKAGLPEAPYPPDIYPPDEPKGMPVVTIFKPAKGIRVKKGGTVGGVPELPTDKRSKSKVESRPW
jgi:DNA invertase Pin-like site-specific DNA recombinase